MTDTPQDGAPDGAPVVPPWPLLGRETLHHCAVFSVARSQVRSPRTGAEHPFFQIESVDWVNIVALTDDDEVVMVHQFRHGSRDVTLEIPGGMVDAGEGPEQAALRELLEESGYAADAAESIGVVNPNPALFGNTCHTYLARGARRVGEVQNEGTEETVVELVPRAELARRVAAGQITHALVMAALHWWHLAETR